MQANNQKSILAKLLATEDVKVEHHNVPTASFNLKTRTISLPNWKDMSSNMYDLFTGHEVGHALETPEAGWHDAVCSNPKLRSFLNILEDVRIEKSVKDRYPGLVKSFFGGYRELFDKDFFGVANIDVNTLPFADRINLQYKVGSILAIEFSDTEQEFITRIDAMTSWNDVETLATELLGINEAEAEELEDQMQEDMDQDSDEQGDESEGDQQQGESQEDDSQEGDKEEQQSTSQGKASDDSEDDEDEDDSEGDESEDEAKTNPLAEWADQGGGYSITDEAFRENEEQLLDEDCLESYYVNVKPLKTWRDFVIPASEMYTGIDKSFKMYSHYHKVEAGTEVEFAKTLAKTWQKENGPIINTMVQQFELKRSAKSMAKSRMSKTGDLNDNRLWAYKVSEDIFKQSQVVPEGKNHGMLMFVDMSGSMNEHMAGTVDQLITQAMFCRKVNIPFEIYGFTNSNSNYGYVEGGEVDDFAYDKESMSIRHLFSGSWTKTQFNTAIEHMLVYKELFKSQRHQDHYWQMENRNWDLRGTPLNTTIAVAIQIAQEFRQSNRVEILNTIFLTDGGATDGIESMKARPNLDGEDYPNFACRVYGRCKLVLTYKGNVVQTGERFNRNQSTSMMLELYKQATGSRLFNYFITGWRRKDVEMSFNEYHRVGNKDFMYADFDTAWKEGKKSGVLIAKDTIGFDARFIIKGAKSLEMSESVLTVESTAKKDLMKGFRNFNKDKVQKRVFLSKFMDMVA